MISKSVLDILACPACESRPPLVLDGGNASEDENSNLACTLCKRKYPIRNGIPILLVEKN